MYNTILLESFRWLHILAGSLALILGPIAMINQDGGRLHRLSGKGYFIGMLVIFCTSIVMSVVKGNWFLFMIGIFSMYLVCTGYRALHLKFLHRGQKPALIDWMILVVSALAAAGLLIMGNFLLIFRGDSFGIAAIVFGAVLAKGVWDDYRRFTIPPADKNHWLLRHITGMMGGYIATITAFLVQNVHTHPAFIAWLMPSLIISPFIAWTVRKIRNGKGKIKIVS